MPDPIARSIATEWPTAAGDVLREGVRRLIDYQDLRYAQLYLDRLVPVRDADARCSADGRLLRETARQLALRMSYEDVIRVAQAKIEPRRIARIAAELGADGGTPFAITEFLKPGVEEICSVLPPGLARRILGLAERRRWLDRLQWGMQVKTTSIAGFLRLWVLARLRRFRRGTHRYQEEQRTIEAWLASILEAARLSPDLALEVAHCAGLIKGYGDTLKRGTMSYQLIAARVIEPALAEQIPLAAASDAVASARAAALADPEGEALQRCLDEIEQHASLGVAAE